MPWCATAATDGYHIVVNPAFFTTMTDAEAEFVLAHEVLHCVFGHADRRRGRRSEAWNQATDFATNAILVDMGFTFPGVGLYRKAYAGQSAEAIYDLLVQRGEPAAPGSIAAGGRPGGLAEAPDALRRAMSPDQLRRLVAHGGWDIQLDPSAGEGSGLLATDMPTEIERRRMRDGLTQQMRGSLAGRTAGFTDEEIAAATRSQLTWEDLLARFVTGIRRSDYRSYPFNKKHIHRGIYLPSVGAPGPQHLVVAVDTSGSIDLDTASRVLAEVDNLRAATECRLTVIQCDAEIQQVQEFDPWEDSIFDNQGRTTTLRGRGGTSFVPVFEWLTADEQGVVAPPDAIIYLTDGYGQFPAKEPLVPTVWVLVGAHASLPKVPFGAVIELPRNHV